MHRSLLLSDWRRASEEQELEQRMNEPNQIPMTMIGALRFRAERTPDKMAYVTGSDIWTYRRLLEESERLAEALRGLGIAPGDRVALHMTNVPEIILAYYACFLLGAIASPLNIRIKAAELHPLLRRLRPALYLGQRQLYPEIADLEADILPLDRRFVTGGEPADAARPWQELMRGGTEQKTKGPMMEVDANAPAALLSTSGTTGEMKLVAHTAASLGASADAYRDFALSENDVAVMLYPMMHAGGLFTFSGCIRFGAPMAFLERFDPEVALDAIEAQRCTWLPAFPYAFAELTQHQQAHPRDVSSLRETFTGGDVPPEALEKEFQKTFGRPYRNVWGSTESGMAIAVGLHPGPVSRVPTTTEIRIIDEAGKDLPRGEEGEMLLRAPTVAAGYWQGPGKIQAFPNGWFATGDIMRQGEGNEIWYIARKKELIVRGGSNIAPVEVEQALKSNPAVKDAAVFGVPDPELGQRVAALVQLTDNASLDDIRADVATRLADYKVPEQLKAVDTIPRNSLGKVDRQALAGLLSEEETS